VNRQRSAASSFFDMTLPCSASWLLVVWLAVTSSAETTEPGLRWRHASVERLLHVSAPNHVGVTDNHNRHRSPPLSIEYGRLQALASEFAQCQLRRISPSQYSAPTLLACHALALASSKAVIQAAPGVKVARRHDLKSPTRSRSPPPDALHAS
jgi:hypothetical protein